MVQFWDLFSKLLDKFSVKGQPVLTVEDSHVRLSIAFPMFPSL